MRLSDAYFHEAELPLSIAHARRAAAMYVPGAAHVERAMARLLAIARGSERASDTETAAAALRAAKAALIATGGLGIGRGSLPEIEHALQRIAERRARASEEQAAREQPRQAAVSPAVPLPDVAVRGALFCTAFGALFMAAWALLRSLHPSGHFQLRRALPAGAGCALCVAGWALALLLA